MAQKLDTTPANTETSGPAETLFTITPSDTVDVAFVTTGIYVGTAGDLAVIDRRTQSIVIFRSVPAGSILPIRVDRVRATGTTAGNLVGLA